VQRVRPRREHERGVSPIASMIDDFYTLLPWDERTLPTPRLEPEEVHLLRRLMSEEIHEFVRASKARDIVKIADAVADITYVAYGAAKQYGIDVEDAIRAIHRANLRRVRSDLGTSVDQTTSVDAMAVQWYTIEEWPHRPHPTGDIPDKEVALLQKRLSQEQAKFIAATEEENAENIAIAIAGIAYVAHLAALHFGFNLLQVVAAVHQANMSKRADDGTMTLDDSTGKVVRGDRYRPPDIAGALRLHRAAL
jgi:predicted HAD superfamily Cof-like phosphohydrolase